ncbi:MAG: hypothetical protein VKP62_00805 [Candidatus Sericytochromatia bacterium]|nr:hypothetical protein [Candidatus Sericytochromatia bacterium]
MVCRLLLGVALAGLLGCADPPGMRKPLPLDPAEEGQALATYRKAAQEVQQVDGVLGTYLTRTNNPREMVVVVRDKPARKRVGEKFGGEIAGLSLRVELAPKGFEDEQEPIEEVQNEKLPSNWREWLAYAWNEGMQRLRTQVEEWRARWRQWRTPRPEEPNPAASMLPT